MSLNQYMLFLKLTVCYAHLPGSIFGKMRYRSINHNMHILISCKSNKIRGDNRVWEVLDILSYASSYQRLSEYLNFTHFYFL